MNMRIHALLVGAALLGAAEARAAEMPSLVPVPVSMEVRDGSHALTPEHRITYAPADPALRQVAEYLSAALAPAMGYQLKVASGGGASGSKVIALTTEGANPDLGDEGYTLRVTDKNIRITARTATGLFYGAQTLRQLLPPAVYASSPQADVSWTVPQVEIEDEPRFSWRGLHLDVCRHFMPPEFIKKYIDLLAMHKMNSFHWHLTEDQGWRIEIPAYPKLTEVGAWRKQTVIGKNSGKYDGTPHGGFYTTAEIRDIVAYANERCVNIVPEIEMPGHALAALAAYPELSCTGGPFEVATRWGVFGDVYCAGNDETFRFLEAVLDQVLELFPSPFIHVGGDECPKGRWKKCAKCQARMKAEGLKNEHELQSYLIKHFDRYLAERGRRLIGWDEILEGGLAPGAVVMSWRGTKGGIAAAKQGNDVVMAPNSHLYFDYYQAKGKEPLAIGGFIPLSKTYSFEPIPAQLTATEAKHVLGAQGQLWTEYMKTPGHVEYMAYPRACALAEVVWSPKASRDYAAFVGRMAVHAKRLTAAGVNFRPLTPEPVPVARWRAGETSEAWSLNTWDITKALTEPGTYEIRFNYVNGTHRLDMAFAEIVEGGNVVARDEHPGTTGVHNKDNTYKLNLGSWNKDASYELRARVRSDGGADSNGYIYVRRIGPAAPEKK